MRHSVNRRSIPWTQAVAAAVIVSSAAACDFVESFVGASSEARLAEAALAVFAAPGAPFMEARFSRDTVGLVTETGERTWDVTIPDGASTWVFEVTRAEVYPVYAGEAFAPWLEQTARGLGLRGFIPPDGKSMIASGSVTALGDLEVAFGPSGGRGRTPIERVALLRAGTDGDSWSVEGDGNRSARVVRDALKLVYADMLARDERVQTCMGSVDARSVPRATQLECVADALELVYGTA